MVRRTLFGVLRYIIFWSVVITLLVSGILFAWTFFDTVRAQKEDNVVLLARTTAYSTEAAVIFRDEEETAKILNSIIQAETICQIKIYRYFTEDEIKAGAESQVKALITIGGKSAETFFQISKTCDQDNAGVIKKKLISLLASKAVRVEIIKDRIPRGLVEIVNDDAVFVDFLYKVAGVLIACLLLAIVVAHVPARWMERRFATELASLSGMAHAARLENDFTRRLPEFEIVEFNGLGQDFNALFSEIQARNAELALRQSHLETINRTLSSMLMCDALTGLANRACFGEQLEIAISKARSAGTRVGVLYIDNDHFKDINDNYGHSAGDSLLVNVGKRLSGAVRESDLVARLGGDEFAILLTPVNGEDDLRHVSNKILAAMARKLRLAEREGIDIELGVSIGMAVFPDQAQDALSLLRAADHAMYRAKRLGRARACMYDPSVDAVLEDE